MKSYGGIEDEKEPSRGGASPAAQRQRICLPMQETLCSIPDAGRFHNPRSS